MDGQLQLSFVMVGDADMGGVWRVKEGPLRRGWDGRGHAASRSVFFFLLPLLPLLLRIGSRV